MATASGNKVMLVEDDAGMRSVLRTLLEIEGFHVSVAPDNQRLEGILTAARQENPDIILLDVHLHQTSGLEVVKHLRSDPQTSTIRVLMSSGMDIQDECMSAGADGFILKPFMPDELLDQLAKLQDRQA